MRGTARASRPCKTRCWQRPTVLRRVDIVAGAMVELPAAADIRCSAETIFELIIDFPGQARWLTKSSAFHGTHEVSSGPVGLGTTYTEPGPFGVRHGEVTELERPTKATFHHPMTLKLPPPPPAVPSRPPRPPA